jgi:hypothetical protein
VEGEIGVGAAEAGNEVVFEGADGTLSGIGAMDTRRGELEGEALSG